MSYLDDNLIDQEEVEESKKVLQDVNINPKFLKSLRSAVVGFPKDILADQWEKDFYNAHPELRGLIDVGILVLNGRDNIGYPGGDLIYNVNGALICHGVCIKPWGGMVDHVTSCPIWQGMATLPALPRLPPFTSGSSNPMDSPQAKPLDKKSAGWKGHEHYGYDSDVD